MWGTGKWSVDKGEACAGDVYQYNACAHPNNLPGIAFTADSPYFTQQFTLGTIWLRLRKI